MHPNSIYHTADDLKNLGFARARAFGVLAVCIDGLPELSHVPILISDDGTQADLHLVRSNPIARALGHPLTAKIAVSGPDSYVSPDWYGVADQVPTWNYIAVHLTGTLELLPQVQMRDMLDRQSKHFEDQLAPKTPWKTAKMTPAVLEKMMRQIVPCRLAITEVDGTWKMNQNKPDDVRLAAADGVEMNSLGSETDGLAQMMRDA